MQHLNFFFFLNFKNLFSKKYFAKQTGFSEIPYIKKNFHVTLSNTSERRQWNDPDWQLKKKKKSVWDATILLVDENKEKSKGKILD